jgi:uncharacterized protein (DUF697 family)
MVGMFRRKSRWDRLMESAATVAEGGSVRQVAKVTLGVVGGAVAATAASAAISMARQQGAK